MSLLNQEEDPFKIDEDKDYFAELVGEGKKYADEKALAKALAHANAHIKLVETENADYKSDLLKYKQESSAGDKLQELLDKLDRQQLGTEDKTQMPPEDKPALKLDDIENLVTSKIQQTEQARLERDNYNKVEAKLKERYGERYGSVLKQQSVDLGLSDQEVNDMARKRPELFIKTFDLNVGKGEDFQTVPRKTNTFTPKGEKKRTWSYYLDLKKQDPGRWLSDKPLRIQMEKDAQRLGAAFYDV